MQGILHPSEHPATDIRYTKTFEVIGMSTTNATANKKKTKTKQNDLTAKSVARQAAALQPWYKKLASDKAYAWSIYLAAKKGDANELRDLVTPEVKHDGVLSFTATPGKIIVSLRLRGARFSNRFDVR